MAPGSAVESVVLSRLNETASKLRVKTNELYGLVVKLADEAPGPIAKVVVSAWNKYLAKYQVIEDRLALVPSLGSPTKLWDAANRWSAEVGTSVSTQAGLAKWGSVDVDDYFTGRAGEAYKYMLTAQEPAMNAVKHVFADPINELLSKIARAIVLCYGVIGAALVVLVGAVVAACASGGAGAPAIIGAAASAVGAIGQRW